MELQTQLQSLKLKRAQLYEQVDMLATVSESLFLQIGKIEVEIHFMERKVLQENKDQFDEN